MNINGHSEIFYEPIKLTTTHNAGKYHEQIRLRQKFKDTDIIVDKGSACYVKGRLQPTKTLGDFYLKHKEFNNPPENMQERYAKRAIENFNGPYIDHLPEIKIVDLTEDDEFLVLASDGLWDWLDSDDVAEIVSDNYKDKKKIAAALSNEVLTKAAAKANMKLEQLLNMPENFNKRSIHDDISILVVDLKNQTSF